MKEKEVIEAIKVITEATDLPSDEKIKLIKNHIKYLN